MIYHVLPGDSLVQEFAASGIEGETIVFRECLIDGDVYAESLEEFWDIRANFLELEYGGDPIEYRESVVYNVERLIGLEPDAEVNFWFEYELFCSANLWFCFDLIKNCRPRIFRVMPALDSPDDVWKGFGSHDAAGLRRCYEDRVPLTAGDVSAASRLWRSFASRDGAGLRELGEYISPAFPFLREVAHAAAEIDVRPAEVITEIKRSGETEFDRIFAEFVKRAGVYGFGDLQVQRLLDRA